MATRWILILFLSIPTWAIAQDSPLDFIGFYFKDEIENQQLHRLDPLTGTTERVGNSGFWGYTNTHSEPAINAKQKQYAFIGPRYANAFTFEGNYFFVLSYETGELVDLIPLPGEDKNGPLSQLAFDCFSETYYTTLGKTENGAYATHLVKMDLLNDTFQNVGQEPFEYLSFYQPTIDHSRNAFVFVGGIKGDTDLRIVSVSLSTGEVISAPIVDSKFAPTSIIYNCMNNRIYGFLTKDTAGKGQAIVTISPETGHVSRITPDGGLPYFGYYEEGVSLDPLGKRYYLFDHDSRDRYLHSFDLETGLMVDTIPISDRALSYPTLVSPCSTHAGFTYTNNCVRANVFYKADAQALRWTWNFGDVGHPNNTSHEPNPSHVYSDTGWVNVTLITETCYATDTLVQQVYIQNFPDLNLGQDTVLCRGDSIVFNLPTDTALTYTWSNGVKGGDFTVTEFGTYSITSANSLCFISDSLDVRSTPAAALDLGPDYFLCPNTTDTFDVSIFGNAYLWQDGFTLPAIIIDTAGTYHVTVTDDFCAYSDSINIQFSPPVPDLIPSTDTSICPGTNIPLNLSPDFTFLWDDGSTDRERYLTAFPGRYFVTVTNQHGCRNKEVISIDFLDIGPTNLILDGDTLRTEPNNAKYQWLFEERPIPNSNTPFQEILLPGTYEVQRWDHNGCLGNATLEVEPLPCSNLQIWPNPLKDRVSLKAPRAYIFTVRLMDETGKVIYLQEEINVHQFSFDFPPSLASGNYFLEVQTNQCTEMRKIVLAK